MEPQPALRKSQIHRRSSRSPRRDPPGLRRRTNTSTTTTLRQHLHNPARPTLTHHRRVSRTSPSTAVPTRPNRRKTPRTKPATRTNRLLHVAHSPRPNPNNLPKRIRRGHGRLAPTTQILTLFAGRRWCLAQWAQGLYDLPAKDCKLVAIDNSRDPTFLASLGTVLALYAPQHTTHALHSPKAEALTPSDYEKTHTAIARKYQHALSLLDPSIPFTLTLEDDCQPPPGTLPRLHQLLRQETTAAAAAGATLSRIDGLPLAWHTHHLNALANTHLTAHATRITHCKPLGYEPVGAAGFGCTLFQTRLLLEIGIRPFCQGLWALDLIWGHRANALGYHLLLDWSTRVKHYFRNADHVDYVQPGVPNDLAHSQELQAALPPFAHQLGLY